MASDLNNAVEPASRDQPSTSRRAKSLHLLVVSHACVLPVNQLVYAELARRGVRITLVTPATWQHGYSPRPFRAESLPELESGHVPLRVIFPGSPQRHLYLAWVGRVLRNFVPDVVFVEEESFSIAACQWASSLSHSNTPFGVQIAENLDRSLPSPVIAWRTAVLKRASFVAARSWSASELAVRWGATGEVAQAFHHTPLWEFTADSAIDRPFTVGYAGRLVPEKGIRDLVAAVQKLDGPVRLVLAGAGPMRDELASIRLPRGSVEIMANLTHDTMPEAYGEMDVLVLPSRTTPTWAEQFGRVITEALWCGVPVIGSDSGEIPRLIAHTQGGVVFPEGDVEALSDAIRNLRDDPMARRALARAGRAAVQETFSVGPAADQLERLVHNASTSPP